MIRAALLYAALLVGATPTAMAMTWSDSPSAGAAGTAYDQAVQLVNAQDYKGAAALLAGFVATDPSHADAWNYLGYSERKLGNLPSALAAYGKALALQPEHRGANEYMGELYLEMGDLAKAKERLAVLDRACWLPCDEYTELKGRIEAYEAGRPAKTS
jgi:tetratricopeptide (TPR) repeat protein